MAECKNACMGGAQDATCQPCVQAQCSQQVLACLNDT
jgi:hypothetical protein